MLPLWKVQGKAPSRMRLIVAVSVTFGTILFLTVLALVLPHTNISVPKITIQYTNQSAFNESKVALLIENRPQPIIVPLMLHFMYQMPPDWQFQFMGSDESIAFVNSSASMKEHVKTGKVQLTHIPKNMSTAGQEMISQFLTTLWLYEEVLQPAEVLLIFQTDSVICSNNKNTTDDFIGWDWVGAPWNAGGRWGGNGGLSIRRVSRIMDVLRNQERREHGPPEDVWLSERLGDHNAGSVANGSVSVTFSGEMNGGPGEKVPDPECPEGLYDDDDECRYMEMQKALSEPGRPGDWVRGVDDWRNGYYEPMGYHIGGAGQMHGGVWGKPDMREHNYKYCPESKMVLKMDFANFVPGDCAKKW